MITIECTAYFEAKFKGKNVKSNIKSLKVHFSSYLMVIGSKKSPHRGCKSVEWELCVTSTFRGKD